MDKRLILAVAGSGKTTYIINSLNEEKRSLIVTYTETNYKNIKEKILNKFGCRFPENIELMTYFGFLYKFCYRPFLSDNMGDKGITFETSHKNGKLTKRECAYYKNSYKQLYHNRLSLLLIEKHVIQDIKDRLVKYFDEFFIDEIQDIAGNDFDFIMEIAQADMNMLFVGDFYQHTFDTSRDGSKNKNLYKDFNKYKEKYKNIGFYIDEATLHSSWRCSRNVCEFISKNLNINIESNREENDNTKIEFISSLEYFDSINNILEDRNIVKLYYNNSYKHEGNTNNWGNSKGMEYRNICVILNNEIMIKFINDKLNELSPLTKNKLYVAITRAKGDVYFIDEDDLKQENTIFNIGYN